MRRLTPEHAGWLLLAILCVGAAAQGSRLPMRWGPVAIAYGAYVAEWRHAASTQGAWLTTWVGLHPPLFAALLTAGLKLGLPPMAWLAASGAASTSAVLAVGATVSRALGPSGRLAALMAAAFVALSPHRVAYGLEVNNYPLLVGALGAQGLAFAHWARGGRSTPLVLTSALLPWAHLLGGTALVAQWAAVALLDRGRLRALSLRFGLAGIALLPLIPGLIGALGDPINDGAGLGGALSALILELPGRYGLGAAGWATAGLALLGAHRAWTADEPLVPVSWILQAVVGTAAVLGAMATAQASDVQLQYWLVPLLPTLALAGTAFVGRERDQRLAAVAAAILLGNGAALGLDAVDARWVRSQASSTHPVTVGALAEWRGDDVLLLVGLPSTGDDDKSAVDPVWAAVPMGRSLDYRDPGIPGLTAADPYWGQPVRLADGRWLYTFANLNVERLAVVAAAHGARGQRVAVAGYGLARHPTAARELAAWAAKVGATPIGSVDEIAFVAAP